MDQQSATFEFLCRMGDNALILGHRVSEWCGKAPALEEDIALANVALDLIGQTQMWLGLAAEVEGNGRNADDLAMLRDVWDFRNILLVEQPNGDFGRTLMRQYLFDQWHLAILSGLTASSEPRIAEIAAKSVKEARYHVERSADLVVRLGDGSTESHARMQAALTRLWPFFGEVFEDDPVDVAMDDVGIAPLPSSLRDEVGAAVRAVMARAKLDIPTDSFAQKGGRTGVRHSEHLGHLLTQMQWLQRAYPGSVW